jgi:hypothetical protein
MEGTAIRRIDMHCGQNSSNKDYRITVTQLSGGLCRVYFEHGPAGRLQQGGEKTAKDLPVVIAMQVADKLILEKENGRSRYSVMKDWTLPESVPTVIVPVLPRHKPTISIDSFPVTSRALINHAF